jgi:hypothetical protein
LGDECFLALVNVEIEPQEVFNTDDGGNEDRTRDQPLGDPEHMQAEGCPIPALLLFEPRYLSGVKLIIGCLNGPRDLIFGEFKGAG